MTTEEMLKKLVAVHEWMDGENELSKAEAYDLISEVVVFLVEHPDAIRS